MLIRTCLGCRHETSVLFCMRISAACGHCIPMFWVKDTNVAENDFEVGKVATPCGVTHLHSGGRRGTEV